MTRLTTGATAEEGGSPFHTAGRFASDLNAELEPLSSPGVPTKAPHINMTQAIVVAAAPETLFLFFETLGESSEVSEMVKAPEILLATSVGTWARPRTSGDEDGGWAAAACATATSRALA